MLRRGTLRRRSVIIPNVGTRRSQPQHNDFRKGWVTYLPNDLRPKESFSVMTDSRAANVGNYITRKGCDFYSVPIGEAVNVQVNSTTGADEVAISESQWAAQKLTATATGPASKAEVNIKNDDGATGTVIVELYTDDSGPGVLLATSSIAETDITSSLQYLAARFIEAPTITNAQAYWLVFRVQGGSGQYIISTTTNSTNAATAAGGGAWSNEDYSLNAKLYTATAGGVKGTFRAYRPNGSATTFFAHGTTLYSINDTNGVTTSVDAGLHANTEKVRFEFVNDELFYTTGQQKPRKYNWTTASEITAAPGNARSLLEHVGVMFYLDAADLTKMFFTNFADYETFTSTDFIYIPAPKRSDYATALAKLNGAMYVFSKGNKYVLYGQDNATFRLDEAPAQKGTFSQSSVVADHNYIYFAADDGVYMFNGTTEENLTFNKGNGIQDRYEALIAKQNIVLEVHNNRLYVWYTPNGQAENSRCFVYNLLMGAWESDDTRAHIGSTFARRDLDELFLQGSNRLGAVYYGERDTNDHHNLGAPMEFEVRTSFEAFGTPEQQKRITKWRPHFQGSQGDYSAQVGYAADFGTDVTFQDVELQTAGYTYDSADSVYDSATYAAPTDVSATTLEIPGEARRWQRIYKHHAAREPVEFTGEVLAIQTQRMR